VNGCLVGEFVVSGGCLDKLALVVEHSTLAHLDNKFFNIKQPVLRIRDVYPGSRILIFTHPGSRIQKQQQKRGVKKKFVVITFSCSHKFHKIEVLKKKCGPIFKEL
jgi:hypothetical protein